MKCQCVLFDLDGTLVDSEILCNQAFIDLLPQLGPDVETLVWRFRGKRLDHILRDIEEMIDRKLAPDFELQYRMRVSQLFASSLEPMPGVYTMLDNLSLPKCIVSNGPLLKIGQALKKTGLDAYFVDAIVSSHEVGIWKPDPGLYVYAARKMGVEPAACAVVEDSDVGVQAALAAGMIAFHFQPQRGSNFDRAIPFFDMSQLNPLLLKST